MVALKNRPEYKPPKVVTYQEEEILKQMGPVKGGTGNGGTPAAPMNPLMYPLRRDLGTRKRKYRSSLYPEDD